MKATRDQSSSSSDEEQQEESKSVCLRNRRKIWMIISLSLILIAAVSLSILLPLLLRHNHDEEVSVDSACKSTRYPDVCIASLRDTKQKSRPKDILMVATKAALRGVSEMLNLTISYRRDDEVHAAKAKSAFDDCVDLLGGAMEELQSSLDQILQGDYQPEITDIQTWMSAAMTYQDTCMDELSDASETGDKPVLRLRKLGQNIQKLLSNALALVNPLVAAWRRASSPTKNEAGEQHWSSIVERELAVDAVVAQDGSGHFARIQDALNAAPRLSRRRFVIHIRAGVYREYINVKRYQTNIVFIGDGAGKTIITGNRNVLQPGITTWSSATVTIEGRNFMARDLTIENTSGPRAQQAVALRVGADQSAFYRCSVSGYQDTLLAHVFRQFYRDCTISGTVDFVFGNAAAVFQNCRFNSRVPLPGQQTVITAQGRSDPGQNTGFSFHMCSVGGDFPVYLGRPWKEYARVVWLRSEFQAKVQPSGWLSWEGSGDFGLRTSYFAEYLNWGPGSGLRKRVKWSKVITRSRVARKFTPVNFIAARLWLPRANVIFDSKL